MVRWIRQGDVCQNDNSFIISFKKLLIHNYLVFLGNTFCMKNKFALKYFLFLYIVHPYSKTNWLFTSSSWYGCCICFYRNQLVCSMMCSLEFVWTHTYKSKRKVKLLHQLGESINILHFNINMLLDQVWTRAVSFIVTMILLSTLLVF